MFKIQSEGNKITASSSPWYVDEWMENYESVDEFNEELERELTEEEFNDLKKNEFAYILDSGNGEIVTSIPLTHVKEYFAD